MAKAIHKSIEIEKTGNEKLQDMIGQPILDVPCKKCNSENTHHVDTDETDFSYDGTGHYFVDYRCQDCGERFRVYFHFKYEITKAYYRN